MTVVQLVERGCIARAEPFKTHAIACWIVHRPRAFKVRASGNHTTEIEAVWTKCAPDKGGAVARSGSGWMHPA